MAIRLSAGPEDERLAAANPEALPRRIIELDGTPLDVFPLPTDSASLEALLADLFENRWREIAFGPIIQGAAWEMRADKAPTTVGVLDGPRNQPTSPELAAHRRTSWAEPYRTRRRSRVPMSWGLRLFNGAGEQQITVLSPNPFLDPDTGSISQRAGLAAPCAVGQVAGALAWTRRARSRRPLRQPPIAAMRRTSA